MNATPRTYAAYLRESKKRQTAYVKREQERMAEASRLFTLYQAAMALLDLHPLDRSEISDRLHQLDRMAATVEQTHGDNESQRAIFEAFRATDLSLNPEPPIAPLDAAPAEQSSN